MNYVFLFDLKFHLGSVFRIIKLEYYFILYLIKAYKFFRQWSLLLTSDAERRTVDACDIDGDGLSHDL